MCIRDSRGPSDHDADGFICRGGGQSQRADVIGAPVQEMCIRDRKDALRDQMGWIRNRTTLMGVNPAYIDEDLPYFHMWMEGTGSYSKLCLLYTSRCV